LERTEKIILEVPYLEYFAREVFLSENKQSHKPAIPCRLFSTGVLLQKIYFLFLDFNQTSVSMNRAIARRTNNPSTTAALRILVDVVERLIPFSEEFCDPKVDHHHRFGHVI